MVCIWASNLKYNKNSVTDKVYWVDEFVVLLVTTINLKFHMNEWCKVVPRIIYTNLSNVSYIKCIRQL